jgi:endoglucanase
MEVKKGMIKSLFLRGRVLLLTVAFLGGTLLGSVNVEASTAWTGMRNITSQQLVSDMKLGWNLGNTFDAGNETNWGNPYTTHAMIDQIKAAGFNTIRIPVTWNTHIGSAPNYTIDSAYISRVEQVMNYAFDNNMYVIINLHHENSWILPWYANQSQTTKELTAVWTQIANKFKGYSDYLIFETMNEPRPVGQPNEWTGGTYENRDVINKYNLAAVNAIRNTGGNNTSRHIMIPTISASASSVAVNDLVIPNNDSRVIVSLHMYSPYSFAMDTGGTSNWGSATDKSSLDAEFDAVYNKFVKNGRAVVIGEMGSINKNNTSSRAALAEYYVKSARARGLTPVWWDNGITTAGSESYGIFNRNKLTWAFPDIAQALARGSGSSSSVH